eukprot:Skav222274  [mRNA]  locus=scaffold807:38899:39594:+ [translate_table: standard]
MSEPLSLDWRLIRPSEAKWAKWGAQPCSPTASRVIKTFGRQKVDAHWSPAVLAASLAWTKGPRWKQRHMKRTRRRSFPWLSNNSNTGGEDSSASRWWRNHPRAGDILIGWVT